MPKTLTFERAGERHRLSLKFAHTLVIGSGAAGLSAAVQLHRGGIEDLLILTEGLRLGTSINTGSDKQTYYKLNLCGDDEDAPLSMARNYFDGGSMHGDLALVEAAQSTRAFLNLVELGVPFPQDPYGQFVGYKTDHDPRTRATSIGPYTSRRMCEALIAEAKRRRIPLREKVNVVSLLTSGTGRAKRVVGALMVDAKGRFEAYGAENVVFAVGGPGGLYRTSVYPNVHTGAIGLAMLAGARCQALSESQYGMASIKFRWNVSGTYMQVIPRFISTETNGEDEREFLRPYFESVGEMCSMIFLKGYQWPFDPRKVPGSSIIDILVYIETVVKGRRVWLDFRRSPTDFKTKNLSKEAGDYLANSKASQPTPIARLQHMNPAAIELYRDHGIDIAVEPLEIAVCAQHNNGGLAANHWWESLNIRHLFPVGEVNGSHGVYRPGGSAINAGQVGAIRAADFIRHRYAEWTVERPVVEKAAQTAAAACADFLERKEKAVLSWQDERATFQERMSRAAAHIRAPEILAEAVKEARAQWRKLSRHGCGFRGPRGRIEALRTRHLCFAHLVYLEAAQHAVLSGVGSRGSALVLAEKGAEVHPGLDAAWRFLAEDPSFREKVLETDIRGDKITCRWVPRRPLPQSDTWFETAWAAYRKGAIYKR